MTRNKDQKRLVRARMKKTGESYTAARAVVLARGSKRPAVRTAAPEASATTGGADAAAADAPPADAGYAAPRREWASLAGMSDEAVQRKTGRTWAEWVAVLDRNAAHRMSHRDIARQVAAFDGVSGWWAQMVTVGYERIRGLRDVGQRRDGAYEANKSRTFPVHVSTLYRMFADARRRRVWLPEGVKRMRSAIADKSIRVDWQDGTRVAFYFTAKGPTKSTVSVQHAGLASRGDVGAAKAAWEERLKRLGEALAE